MIRGLALTLAALATPAAAQLTVIAPFATTARQIYSSNGTATVGGGGANGNARTSMLPAGMAGSSLVLRAGTFGVGSCLYLTGSGAISAANVSPGTFTFSPNITPVGGSKTDLGGLSVTPLIGVAGITQLWMNVCQTSGGLLTSGIVQYGTANGMPYALLINPSQTVVASDPAVDRTFGVDGQWQFSNSNNYVTAHIVTITLAPMAP